VFVLAVGLGILWLVGLSSPVVPSWLLWLDFVVALLSLGTGLIPDGATDLSRAAPFVLGLGLLVLWIVGLATHAVSWFTWWNFAFGVAYLLFGAAGTTERLPRRRMTGPRPI
jgi:hypothetical protein